MDRGPRPTPTNLIALRNNPGKRAINRHEPKPRGKAECPQWLSSAARKVWRRRAPELNRLGVLTSVDTEVFAEYCAAAAKLAALEVEIQRLEARQAAAYRAAEIVLTVYGMVLTGRLTAGAAGIDMPFEAIADVLIAGGVNGEGARDEAIAAAAKGLIDPRLVDAAERVIAAGNGTGLLAVGDKGAPYQHPLVGMRNALVKELRVLASEFGMTPAARTRISVEQPAAQGDLFGGGMDRHERPEPGQAAAAGGR